MQVSGVVVQLIMSLMSAVTDFREDKHVDCDRRLESELEGLRARTAAEMEQLRTQTREMYERENRVLCEARDAGMSERDRAKTAEKETSEKYESLLKE